MFFGEQECLLEKDSNAYKSYNMNSVLERHRHRYEFK